MVRISRKINITDFMTRINRTWAYSKDLSQAKYDMYGSFSVRKLTYEINTVLKVWRASDNAETEVDFNSSGKIQNDSPVSA